MVYNYQIFYNVQTKEEFLGNIKAVAVANGWVCDKDDISNSNELYLHSLGGGNQRLYYGLKVQNVVYSYGGTTWTTTNLSISANTGFDASLAFDNQPGKWFLFNHALVYNINLFSLLGFPITAQYIFANSQMVLCFCDISTSVFSPRAFLKQRYIKHFGFGTIDSYKGTNETEANYVFTDQYIHVTDYTQVPSGNQLSSAILGCYPRDYNISFYHLNAGLLYNGSNQFNENCGISVPYIIMIVSTVKDLLNHSYSCGSKGYRYRYAVQYNDWCSRLTLVKPIVSIYYTDATNQYFFPIGELPYYACLAYPYVGVGDIITYGQRKFMVFPILAPDIPMGVAVEIA